MTVIPTMMTLVVSMIAAPPASANAMMQQAASASPEPGRVPQALPLGDLGPGIWMPEQASTVAPGIDLVFDIITWICIVFFVLICVIMAWFVWKYHNAKAPKSTSSVTHNTPLELTWTIIPLILVIGIFYVGLQGYLNLRVAPPGSYQVRVTAQKWSWLFEHSNGASEGNVLRVPVNKPVQLLMQSSDVLHACFIPAFRVKQDIVPGRITTLWFEATKVGEFDLYCAEYCGKDHSLMRATVIVMEEDEFYSSLQAVADEHKTKPDSELAQYAMDRLFSRCVSCHSLDGRSGTGPSWRETNELWGKERVMADGSRVIVDENYIRDSILNPGQHIVANFTNAMPTFKGQLDDRQVWALILAMRNLQHFDNNGKLKPDAAIDFSSPASGPFPGSNPDGTSAPAAN